MNSIRVGMLLILEDGTKDLGPGGVVKEIFFSGFPDIERDGCEHSLSAPIKVVAVEVADRKSISSSIPKSHSCKGLNPLEDFPVLGCSPVI